MPCGHALMAVNTHKVAHGSLVGDWYKVVAWVDTYSGAIYPEMKLGDIDIPLDLPYRFMLPPFTRRPSGRPKENRIPSIGEFQVP